MAEIKIKVVDEKLGAGTYEIYLQTHDEYTEEVERAENNLERYKPFFQKARFDTLDNDLKIANLIERDYKICLERISNLTSSTDTSMAPKIQRVFEAAIRVLVKVNTTLEDFHTTGIQGLFLQLQSCKLDEKAKKLVLALKPYQAALDKARKQKTKLGYNLVSIQPTPQPVSLWGHLGSLAAWRGALPCTRLITASALRKHGTTTLPATWKTPAAPSWMRLRATTKSLPKNPKSSRLPEAKQLLERWERSVLMLDFTSMRKKYSPVMPTSLRLSD
ncbi:MAG: hypothetical protein IPL59_12885 [Candidatus Competibacteraceae bacterium]|nr:hypothetical protein [Candidatus Competibacteraceae bacterium]